MEVWIVCAETYGYSSVAGVFSTVNKAEEAAKNYANDDIASEKRGCHFKYGRPDYIVEGPYCVDDELEE